MVNVRKRYVEGQITEMCCVVNIGENTKRNISNVAKEIKAVLKQKYVITVERVCGPQI